MLHRRFPLTKTIWFPLALSFGMACSLQPSGELPPEVAMDDEALLSTAVHYRDTAAFLQINDVPYASALGGGAIINLYISAPAFASFAIVEPDAVGTGITLPEGALIVREVLDEAGNVQKLTLMAKGPAGYNPELGDYWFAVTELDGTPVVEDGVTLVGRLQGCYGCHDGRAGDDFLFGVPADNRKPFGEPRLPPRGGGGGGELPPPAPPPPPTRPTCGDFVCQRGESCFTCRQDCRCGPADGRFDDHDHGLDHGRSDLG